MAPRVPQTASLALRYLVVAASAFVIASVALPWAAPALSGHYYHPHVLALTHTVTLGWITLTIMGASYQLVPILFERAVLSERVARWQLPVYAVGVIGIVGHFAIGDWTGLVCSAALLTLAALAHVVNVGGAVMRARASFTARMMGIGLVGFALTALFGTLLGADRAWAFLSEGLFPRLHAHVHLALLGWVLPVVMAVAARVYPMFLLAPEPEGLSARVQVVGIIAGVPLVVVGLLAGLAPVVVIGSVLVAIAILAHVASVVVMARAAKRPALGWPLRFMLTGAFALLPATALGLGLALDVVSGPRMALAYAVLALGGWASLTIVGMLLKIVPFLVWYRVYAPRAGRSPVPTLAQLSWTQGEAIAFTLLTLGVGSLALAVAAGDSAAIRVAGSVVAAGALAFGAILTGILRHLAHGAPHDVTMQSAPSHAS